MSTGTQAYATNSERRAEPAVAPYLLWCGDFYQLAGLACRFDAIIAKRGGEKGDFACVESFLESFVWWNGAVGNER